VRSLTFPNFVIWMMKSSILMVTLPLIMTSKVVLKFQGRWTIVNQRLSVPNEWQTIVHKSYIQANK
jgi:hypothetical protein